METPREDQIKKLYEHVKQNPDIKFPFRVTLRITPEEIIIGDLYEDGRFEQTETFRKVVA